jgi:hypothetical protein
MCSAKPRAPKVVKSGPNKAQIDAQNEQMAMLRLQMQGAQERLQSRLDEQIAAANAQREEARASLAEQTAAMQAEATGTAPYTASTTTAEPAAGTALITEPMKPRRRRSAGLTIAPAGTATVPGAGLNIVA